MTVENHGTICLVTGDTEQETNWLHTTAPDDALWWGVDALVVEPRYVDGVLSAWQQATEGGW